jgi:hypothetical protein
MDNILQKGYIEGMKKLVTHTLLGVALAMGLFPAGQCVALNFSKTQCCISDNADCACCHGDSNTKNKLSCFFTTQPCCSTSPENGIQLPPAVDFAAYSFVTDVPPLASFILHENFGDMALQQAHDGVYHPPDTPLYLSSHALLV